MWRTVGTVVLCQQLEAGAKRVAGIGNRERSLFFLGKAYDPCAPVDLRLADI